jgi:hypothetical protein
MAIAYDIRPATDVHFSVTERRRTQTTIFHCLVLSASDRRSVMFDKAAADGGWDPIICDDAQQAMGLFQRFNCQLILVDLDSDGAMPVGFREVTEMMMRRGRLSSSGAPLVMICGNEGDALEEIWARQLGAWLYLPGVDETCDLTMLCSEAKAATEKLQKSLNGRNLARTA